MAVTAGSLEVTGTPIACNEHTVDGARLVITNTGVARSADLGPSGVVFGEGFELSAGATVRVDLNSGDVLFAVSEGMGTTLKILRT